MRYVPPHGAGNPSEHPVRTAAVARPARLGPGRPRQPRPARLPRVFLAAHPARRGRAVRRRRPPDRPGLHGVLVERGAGHRGRPAGAVRPGRPANAVGGAIRPLGCPGVLLGPPAADAVRDLAAGVAGVPMGAGGLVPGRLGRLWAGDPEGGAGGRARNLHQSVHGANRLAGRGAVLRRPAAGRPLAGAGRRPVRPDCHQAALGADDSHSRARRPGLARWLGRHPRRGRPGAGQRAGLRLGGLAPVARAGAAAPSIIAAGGPRGRGHRLGLHQREAAGPADLGRLAGAGADHPGRRPGHLVGVLAAAPRAGAGPLGLRDSAALHLPGDPLPVRL